jgi:hypothetical protein
MGLSATDLRQSKNLDGPDDPVVSGRRVCEHAERNNGARPSSSQASDWQPKILARFTQADSLHASNMSALQSAQGFREGLGSSSCKNQWQEELLQPIAFLGPEVFELNAHAIRPDRSDHSRAGTQG